MMYKIKPGAKVKVDTSSQYILTALGISDQKEFDKVYQVVKIICLFNSVLFYELENYDGFRFLPFELVVLDDV